MRKERIDQGVLDEAKRCADFIKTGKTLLYPADTIWGIGCDASNIEAIEKIKEIKNRPNEKSFITLVSSYRMLQKVVKVIPKAAEELIDVSDRAVTIVYPEATPGFSHLCSNTGEIAVRMILKGFAHQLMERSGRPIISTSANISGSTTGKSLADIDDSIRLIVDCVVRDEFDFEMSMTPSSVIRVGVKNQIEILRK